MWGLKLAPNSILVGRVEVQNGMQYLPQLLWGNVGAACDYSSIAVEEGGSGPASQIVSTVNIGSFVCVNPDGTEVLVDRTYDDRVRVRSLVDIVTPMAPSSGNGEPDWFS